MPEDSRERLIRSAIALIAFRSYDGVGVQELCEHAGVNKGTFYHFFPTKRELVLAALDRQWELMQRLLLEPCFHTDAPPPDRFDAFFQRMYRHQKQQKAKEGRVPGCPFGSLAAEVATRDGVLRQRLDEILEGIVGYFEAALQGEVADPHAEAQTILAYLEGVLLMARTRNDPEVIRTMAAALPRLVS